VVFDAELSSGSLLAKLLHSRFWAWPMGKNRGHNAGDRKTPINVVLHHVLLIDGNLIRTSGANDLAWFDELVD
jgi:hypothetical protein